MADALHALGFASAMAWTVMLALLVMPAIRLVRRRGRQLDSLWVMLLLGVLNRLVSDFGGVPESISRISAILLALTLAVVIRSYQHADR